MSLLAVPVPLATASSSGGYPGFRPVKHGVDLNPSQQAILDTTSLLRQANPTGPSVAPSTGFTQVHVSGLPSECEDDAVETKLRQVLHERRKRAAATAEEADLCTSTIVVADSVANAESTQGDAAHSPTKVESSTEAETEPKSDAVVGIDEADVFVSCTVVRNKDTLACKGYCFLAFHTLAEAEVAVQWLNEGVEVVGSEVRAQLSQPKVAKTKPAQSSPKEVLNDLRIRRKRYQCTSKHAQHGHEAESSGKIEGGAYTRTRNSIGRISSDAGGTRNGTVPELPDSKCSNRSGFRA